MFRSIDGSSMIESFSTPGPIGIGLSDPAADLHVFGSDELLRLADGTRIITAGCNATGPYFGTATNHDLRFLAFNDEKARITTAGRLGIGTTNPAYLLEVNGTSNFVGQFRTADGMTFAPGAGGGVRNVQVDNNGTVSYAVSDLRFKSNIVPVTYGLDTVLQLNPVTFNWKDPDVGGTYTDIGFIAQEVEPVIPEVVRQGQDGYYSLNIQNITAVLTKAIQELSAKNNILEARIAALER